MRVSFLEAFFWVADLKSMSKAAEKLHTSEQAISKCIKKLEIEFNTILFDRTRNGVSLTSSGETIYPDVKAILDQYEKIRMRFKTQPLSNLYKLNGKINIFVAIPLSPIAAILSDSVTDAFSNIRISLIELYPSFLNKNIDLNNSDICITTVLTSNLDEFTKNHSNKYNIYVLDRERISLYSSTNSHLANRKEINLKELKNLPFLCHTPPNETECLISNLLEYNNIPFYPVYSSSQVNQCLSFLKKGKAYYLSSPLPMSLLNANDIVSIPIIEDPTWYHLMLTSKNPDLSPEELVFVNKTHEYFKNTFYQIL
ncbi:transcriptional regulator [Desulfosporosinus orientis DSM 765]|uniref:Transcriptional regulator n=1 Tax=Desulfosporosinus orientis (strain ATCC 19365 / DSM 765 / NCIMB 8382 / VKM B-1628 / Singapore I) TaxID=768706 RepID=G7WEL1_DESOD|nr:LysR family transcriptional regulator [Desulfosporosinus orientis]AET66902.1 transcriptional regulator [Desulfosporosinus orientis DSM 765]